MLGGMVLLLDRVAQVSAQTRTFLCTITQQHLANAQLANLWQQLASKYAGQSRVIFGIMNEPHDGPCPQSFARALLTVSISPEC